MNKTGQKRKDFVKKYINIKILYNVFNIVKSFWHDWVSDIYEKQKLSLINFFKKETMYLLGLIVMFILFVIHAYATSILKENFLLGYLVWFFFHMGSFSFQLIIWNKITKTGIQSYFLSILSLFYLFIAIIFAIGGDIRGVIAIIIYMCVYTIYRRFSIKR